MPLLLRNKPHLKVLRAKKVIVLNLEQIIPNIVLDLRFVAKSRV